MLGAIRRLYLVRLVSINLGMSDDIPIKSGFMKSHRWLVYLGSFEKDATMRLPPFLLLVLAITTSLCRADDWPQWMGPKRDNVWREEGILEKFPEGGPKKLWSTPLAGGYAGPAVAGDRVYVTDFLARAHLDPDQAIVARAELRHDRRARGGTHDGGEARRRTLAGDDLDKVL